MFEILVLWVATTLAGPVAPMAPMAPMAPTAPADSPARSLVPGDVLDREISPQESHRYTVATTGRPLWVEAWQQGADVVLEARPSGGEPVVVDRPFGDQGPESLLVEPSAGAGSVELRVEGLGGDETGAYRLSVAELDPSTPQGADRLAAARHLSAAGHLYHLGGTENRQAVAEELRAARDVLIRLGETESLAWATDFRAKILDRVGEREAAAVAHADAAALWERLGETGRWIRTSNRWGLSLVRLGRWEEAGALFEQCLERAREMGDLHLEAASANNLCLQKFHTSAWKEAADCFREHVLPLSREAGDVRSEVAALNNLGSSHKERGELEIARDYHLEALELLKTGGGSAVEEATTLNNLAVVYRLLGEADVALTSYDRALEIFRDEGSVDWEARILNNQGVVYRTSGEHGRAESRFRQALELRRRLGDVRGEGVTASNLAAVDEARGDLDAAAVGYRRSLELARQAGDRSTEVTALVQLGGVQAATGDHPAALATLAEATALAREAGVSLGLSAALLARARVRFETGDPGAAVEPLTEALEISRSLRDRPGEVGILTLRARVEHSLGDLPAALGFADRAVALVESLRTEMTSPELRAAFVAGKRQAYELAVEIRMDLDRLEPDAGHAAAALEVSEQARARSLLDLLREARLDPEQTGKIPPELAERERRLARRLQAIATLQAEGLGNPSIGPERRDATERELQQVLAELDAVEAEIRRRSPPSGLGEAPRLLDATAIRALLDDDTLLLEYALGEERSHLWAVTGDAVVAFQLPARGEIEALARTVYEDLSVRSVGVEAGEELARRGQLAEMILGPVAELLGEGRLVVITDGALGYIPFAALPRPGGAGELLLERHEILSLPSASVLAALRASRPARAGRGKVAVLADPVFGPDDPRVGAAVVADYGPEPRDDPERGLVRAGTDDGGGGDGDGAGDGAGFERLPATRQEAEAIAGLVPADDLHLALGFESTRGHVLETDWRPFSVLHFATHGVIHAETPALSGLVLTQVDSAGESQPGFLSLGDIRGLELAADLVVLSGCETALGREIRGEGLMGLTQGFFHAGAESLAVSLWRVRDRATAELMERFYRALLDDGLPPAAALAAAQRSIARERRWRDPYYWAPFVFQGDWRSPSPGVR